MARRGAQYSENNRSRSRSRQNNERSRSNEVEEDEGVSETEENEVVASDIRNAFIGFFSKVGYEKGLVFTAQDRQKLIKEQARLKKQNRHARFFNWLAKAHWQQTDEITNVKAIFERRQPLLAKEKIQQAQDIFQKVSYIFCSQVTKELYELLMLILEESLKPEENRQIQNLMSQVYSENSRFPYLGFQFSKYFQLPSDLNLVRKAYNELGQEILGIFEGAFERK